MFRKSKWVIIAGWIVFIYGAFFYFWRGNILWLSIGETLFRFFLLLVFLLVGAGLGRKIFRWLKFESNSFLESFLFGLAIGLAIFTYAVIGFGLVGLLNKWVINLFFIGMYALTYDEIGNIIRQLKDKFKASLSTLKIPSIEIVLLLVLVIQIFFNLVGASVFPSGWDSLGEHLAKAGEWNRLHRLASIPYINVNQWAQPFNVGVLYGMALFLKDAILAQLVHFSFGLLTAVGVYALGKRYFSHRVGLISAAIFYTIPLVDFMSTTAYVDLGLTFYVFFAFYALVNWVSSGKRGWLLISAIISGLALGSKYAGLLFVVILSSGILFGGLFVRKEKFWRIIGYFFIFLALGGLIGSFWYVRAYFIGAYSIFNMWQHYLFIFWRGIKGIWASGFFNMGISQPAFALNLSLPKKIISLSWDVSMHSGRFCDCGAIGIVFLAFLPLLFFPRFRRNKLIKFMLFYSAICFIFWAVLAPYKRYIIPIFPLCGVMVGYVVDRISNFNRIFKSSLYTILILTFLFQMFYLAPEGLDKIYQRMLVFFGLKSQEEYILKNEETYVVFKYINEKLPPEAKIYVLNDPRTFYCDREYDRAALFLTSLEEEKILTKFKQESFTHFVIHKRFLEQGYGISFWNRLSEEFKKEHLRVIYDRYPYTIYRIVYEL